LVLVAAGWVAGLLLAHHLLVPTGVDWRALALLTLPPLAALVLWRKDRRLVLSATCTIAFLLGAARYQLQLPDLGDPGFVAHFNDQGWTTLEGTIADYPDVRDTWTNLTLRTQSTESEGQVHRVRGNVLVRAPRFPPYSYGDELRVSGWLETPPVFEGFSYRVYLARKGIYSFIDRPQIELVASGIGNPLRKAIYATKDRARALIGRLVPDPEAALLQGILLGIRGGIPSDLYDAFNATGTSHIIVISGANMMVIAALFSLSFGRLLGKRRAFWFTIVGLLLYSLLVGADPVVLRAGVMAGLFATALYLGRQSTAYVSLLASAVFLTVINPLTLWDVGFQLSFAATLGLILFTPLLESLLERGVQRFVPPTLAQGLLRYLSDYLIVTLAAMILVIPLVIYHFGRLSWVAPLANALILPVQPPIMVGGGAATLIGMIPELEPLARLVAWIPWLCLAYTTSVVRLMAALPSASVQIGQGIQGWLVAYCALVFAFVWVVHQRQATADRVVTLGRNQASSKAVLGLLSAAMILAGLAIVQLPDGRLHVAFLDVDQGDAILVTTPQGQQILIDGGPSPTALNSALGKQMPFWDRSIDLLVMTHSDEDHATGLAEVLTRYKVGGWLESGRADDDATFAECQDLLKAMGVPRYSIHAGDRLDLEPGLVIEIIHPPEELMFGTSSDSNNNSVVLRLAWGQASLLLTGDLEAEGEQLLLRSGQALSADLLKVGHHGSGGSSTPQFLSVVSPRFAVISVAADNRFGHPDQAVLGRLEQLGTTILRTDEQGTIEFISDGSGLWVETEE